MPGTALPLGEKNMKGFLNVLLAMPLSVVLLSGCEGTGDSVKEISDKTAEITSEQMGMLLDWWQVRPTRVCELSEEEIFDLAGGVAAGTVLTAFISGDIIVGLATSTGTLAVAVPAVAGGVVLAGGTAAVGYVGIKAYCIGQG